MNQLIDNSKCFQSNKLDYLYRFIIYLNFKLETKIRVFFFKFKEFSNNQSPLLTNICYGESQLHKLRTNYFKSRSILFRSYIWLFVIFVLKFGKFQSSCLYVIIILSIYIIRLSFRCALLPFYWIMYAQFFK